MKYEKPWLYDVKVNQLEALDSFVRDPDALEEKLGIKGDSEADDTQFLDAARILYGRIVEATLEMLKPGQPGFAYAEHRRKIIATLHSANERRAIGPQHKPNNPISTESLLAHPNLTTEEDAAQPPQPQ
jgi:hypothetical protein